MSEITEKVIQSYAEEGYTQTDIDYNDNDNIIYIQMVKGLGNGKYRVLDWSLGEGYSEKFEEDIDVPDLLDKHYDDIDKWSTMYYNNGISEIKEVYDEDSNQIIAEIIAEMGGV